MSETRSEIETRIRKQISKNFKKLAPPDGTYQFVVTSARLMEQPSKGDKDGNGAGCRTVAVNVAPLAIEDDTDSVRPEFESTIWLTLPLVNPEVEGHEVSAKTISQATLTLAALEPERVPFVSAKLPSGEWDNSAETKKARLHAQVEATVFATEILDDASILESTTFFATTRKSTSDKGGYFLNGVTAELKAGLSVNELGE